MKLIDLIEKRCSIREYTEKTVEQKKLDYMLKAAQLAPSACNLQPWRFVVVQSEEGKEKIRACYERDWFKTPPLYIIVCGDHNQGWKRSSDTKDHTDIDISIAAEHICLAATEQGLGSCWVCHFDAKRCSELFNIPENIEPIAIIPIGYPAKPDLFEKKPKQRKTIDEIIVKEHF